MYKKFNSNKMTSFIAELNVPGTELGIMVMHYGDERHGIDIYSINDDGWIVGYGINPDGDSHAYLLTPEPATLLLLGISAVMLKKRR